MRPTTPVPISNICSIHIPYWSWQRGFFNFCFLVEGYARRQAWSSMDITMRKQRISFDRSFFSKGHGNSYFNKYFHITAEPSLWVRSMRTKYLYESDLFRCPRRSIDSPVWKSIMKNRDLLKGDLIWKVGKGDKILFWLDNWVENRSLLDITGIARLDITNIDI